MSDYTPTTEDVAVCYMAAGALRTSRREHDALMEAGERYRPEFDRWLASLKAEAMETGYNLGFVDGVKQSKAEAWDEGYSVDRRFNAPTPNPYREVSK